MKELELLIILNNVRSEYILEAQQLRSGEAKAAVRKMSRNRMLLIAAVISLLLLLVGCAAVLIGLQKIYMGRVTFPQYRHEGWTRDLVSINGYVDSANYQATQEWIDFQTAYDADRSLLLNRETIGYEPPEDYWIYNCYTSAMKDKVDEICEKYDLQLAGRPLFYTGPEEILSAIGVPSMVNPAAEPMFSLSGGSCYRSGSFHMVGMVDHCFEGRGAPDTMLFCYFCDRKSVFFPDYEIFEDMDTLDSWECTAWDGTKLVLAQSYSKGVITADVGDFFISVSLDFCYSVPPGREVDLHNPCSRAEFERIASKFAYQISPREPDLPQTQDPSEPDLEYTSWNYNDYMAHWVPGSFASEAYDPADQQKYLDLDGDGTSEMLIWNAQTGIVYEVVTMEEGRALCVYGGGTYAEDDHTRQMYLCEENFLEREEKDGAVQGMQLNEYYRFRDQQLVIVECVMLGYDGKWYWSECGGASSVMWKEITEDEYKAVREKYTRIEIESDMSTDRAGQAESAVWEVLRGQRPFFFSYDGSTYLLDDYCREESERLDFPVTITRYALVDMDGDGIQEAVVDFRFGENDQVMCIVLTYSRGTVYGTVYYYRQLYQLKEDGSFRYSGGGDNDGWGRLRWDMRTLTWETDPADPADDKQDVTWYPYPVSG